MPYTKVKTPAEIAAMRESGRILAAILEELCVLAKPGVTGLDLDKKARRRIAEAKVGAPFLGYQGFPAVVCVSVNDAVVHGIPNNQPFEDGDVVSIDFGVAYRGMITDAARSVVIGNDSGLSRSLLQPTQESLLAGIQELHDGVAVGDVAAAIQSILDGANLGIIRELVGHGVGHALHEDPNIPNYGRASSGPILKAGMTIAIEPMATLGDHRVYLDDDNWTIRTVDRSLAAHFEDTVLITKDGAEILTQT